MHDGETPVNMWKVKLSQAAHHLSGLGVRVGVRIRVRVGVRLWLGPGFLPKFISKYLTQVAG